MFSHKLRIAAVALVTAWSSASAKPVMLRQTRHVPPGNPAKHMLFKVRGTNGHSVYLLGSVHLLSAEAATLPAVVDSAFAHAAVVAFEMNLDTAKMHAQELLLRGRNPEGVTLRSKLSPAGASRADSLLHAYGLSLDALAGFKPWLVSVLTSQLVMQKNAFQPQFGVDVQLDARAHAAKKTIVGLESVDFQLGLFDTLSPEDQERMLTSGHGPDSASHELMRVKDAWAAGNVAALDSLLNRTMTEYPTLYATLVTDRNKRWIPKLQEFLGGDCDALVVVGAGHLVGKDSVIELLKAKGYTVEQQ